MAAKPEERKFLSRLAFLRLFAPLFFFSAVEDQTIGAAAQQNCHYVRPCRNRIVIM